jgi:hypothetical protein
MFGTNKNWVQDLKKKIDSNKKIINCWKFSFLLFLSLVFLIKQGLWGTVICKFYVFIILSFKIYRFRAKVLVLLYASTWNVL